MLHKTWTLTWNDDETIRFARKLSSVFLERAGASAEVLQGIIDRSEWTDLLDLSPRFDEMTPETFYAVAQAKACFDKLECLPNGVDREKVALEKFLGGEYRCGIFNRIFADRERYRFDSDVEAVLHASALKIHELIGDPPDLREVPLRFSVGGATTTIRKKDSDLRHLIEGWTACSEDLAEDESKLATLLDTLPHLTDFLVGVGGEVECGHLQVSNGVLNFVPKNAKTHRAVTNEPDLTKLVQNGYGDVLRSRIKRKGIDLSDSDRQCELARIGSVTGGIATLDLSNASGLISTGLILDQFPESWSDIFFWARTSSITMPDSSTRVLQSYGGMGNGLVFPIESILFHALTAACAEHVGIRHPIVSIYGDDIICNTECVEMVTKVFEAIGLLVNKEKSFWSGPFRESCGSDWFSGYDVRPIYIRDNISLELLYSLHNQFFAKGDEEVCDIIMAEIPLAVRLFGPPGKGDGHLHSSSWKDHAQYIHEDGCSHWSYNTVVSVPKYNFTVSKADHLVPVVHIDSGNCSLMLDDSVGVIRRLAGTDYVLPFGFRSNFLLHPNRSLLERGTRDWALNFREKAVAFKQQTSRDRKRRGWNVRHDGVYLVNPLQPDKKWSDITVFGTPLPGSCDVRIITSTIFG